jgi:phosphodiesterase/alkaline phosphatase D-like protein
MKRREFLYQTAVAGLAGTLRTSPAVAAPDSRQATGVKVGEVSDSAATIWMRLTAMDARRADGVVRKGLPQPFPADLRIADLEGSCPGAPGRVRFVFSPSEDLRSARNTPWQAVSPSNDFTHQFRLSDLRPDTTYYYAAETADPSGRPHAPLRGRFRTAPPPQDPAAITFIMTTCQKYSQLDHPEGFHAPIGAAILHQRGRHRLLRFG